MKVYLITALCFLGILTSCRKSHEPKKEGIQLNQCKDFKFGGESVTLCFEEVLEDSRCPVNVACIWEGVAKAAFTFKKGKQTHSIRLATSLVPGPEKPDTTISGYKIEFLNLEPYPQHPPVHFPDSEVIATVRVTKL